jgi:(1->4)-alpha-D-glucan 1-alpha-D-glucosylmutase
VQFNSQFTFRDAESTVDYLHALGISDCYASSYLAAVPESPHGYDVADPTRLNPDLGTEADYWAWIEAMRSRGMGHVLDVVPNHMGIAKSANPWWLDVLENGACSRYADFFDITWHPMKDELANKVLIPILGDQYGVVLERQELRVEYEHGAFFIRYFDERLPIAPDTYSIIFDNALAPWLHDHPGDDADELLSVLTAADHLPARSSRDPVDVATRAREKEVVKRRLASLADASPAVRDLIESAVRALNGTAGQPRSFDRLDALLNAQSYRLAHWRVASEEINYRRFFDVNQLAALRMEDPAVFDEVHRFVFSLVERGAATGLRVDHVDGLFDPAAYLRRLQQCVGGSEHDFYIVVEKILGPNEPLPADWPVFGTTGYEFAAVVNNLFVDRRNERAFDDIYARFLRERRGHVTFADIAYASKKQVLHETMSGDINSLAHQLNQFSENNRHFRDFTLYSLISTIKEVIACFPVYRTYITGDQPVSRHDRQYIEGATRDAKRRMRGVTSVVFDFLQRLLLKETGSSTREECEERTRFIGKFQQLTGPVTAKAIEDTAFYVYNRFVSLNEVGSDPTIFGLEPASVHAWMVDRQRRYPSALSTTSTHDTKRGEDVRARLNVLSEIPGAWKGALRAWRVAARRHKTPVNGVLVPDSREEYFIYQTLVGAWPFEMDDETARTRFRERLRAYMTKALRESKVHTSWLSPDEEYEGAVLRFIDALLDRGRPNRFLERFEPFQKRIAELGIYNSLAQLVIKATAPGVPDFYQGTEFWDLNLVDPDNRRPVDYTKRREALCALSSASPSDLLDRRTDGRVKMFTATRALRTRASLRDVFEHGEYVPLDVTGSRRQCLFAFARVGWADGGHRAAAITCVPRMIAMLTPDAAAPPLGANVWGDTKVEIPRDFVSASGLCEAFTGQVIPVDDGGETIAMSAATVFQQFPVALLVPSSAADASAQPRSNH